MSRAEEIAVARERVRQRLRAFCSLPPSSAETVTRGEVRRAILSVFGPLGWSIINDDSPTCWHWYLTALQDMEFERPGAPFNEDTYFACAHALGWVDAPWAKGNSPNRQAPFPALWPDPPPKVSAP